MTTRFAGDPTRRRLAHALHGAPLIGIDLGPLTAEDSHRLAAISSTMPAGARRRAASSAPRAIRSFCCSCCSTPARRRRPACRARSRRSSTPAWTARRRRQGRPAGRRRARPALHDRGAAPSPRPRRLRLRALLVENFLVRADGGEFMFCHALIRDGAYASLLHKRRRALHARAAEWFASRDRVLAAEHFDRAEDPRAAAAYLDASARWPSSSATARRSRLVERGLALAVGAGDALRAADGARPAARRARPVRRRHRGGARGARGGGERRRAGPGADRAWPPGCA